MRRLILAILLIPSLSFGANNLVTGKFDNGDKVTINRNFRDLQNNQSVTRLQSMFRYKVGTFTSSASTGNQSVTGLGFKPRFVQFSLLVGGAGHTAYSASGAMDSNGNQWATSAQSSDATDGGVHATVSITNGCIKIYPTSQASYVSMDSDGFTINWNDVAFGATPIGYIAFE
jgi:hypothetical protein